MKISKLAVVVTLLATTAVSTGFAQNSPQLLVIGPVESVNAGSRSAIVLGQHVETDAAAQLAVGESVAVYGLENRDGSIAASAIQLRGPYVPGATSIFIVGTVQRTEPSVGRIVVNGLTVDLTPAMSHGTLSPAVGSHVALSGTQPVSHGVVLANKISGIGTPTGISGIGTPTGISGIGTPTGISGIGTPTGTSGTGTPTGISGIGTPTGTSGTGTPKGISGIGTPTGISGIG